MQGIIRKLIAFFMSVLAFFGLAKPKTTTPPEGYAADGKAVEFCFSSNPSTGFGWTAEVEGDCVRLIRDEYVQKPQHPAAAGAGGWQYYAFEGVREGAVTVTFVYARPWEGGETARTVTAVLQVAADKTVTVAEYREV